MIEYGTPSEEPLTYDQALMYCFWHEPVGHWRLPTADEYFTSEKNLVRYWYEDRDQLSERMYLQPAKMQAIPVRTIHDNC